MRRSGTNFLQAKCVVVGWPFVNSEIAFHETQDQSKMGVVEGQNGGKSGCAPAHAKPVKVGLSVWTSLERAQRDLAGHPNMSGLSILPQMASCLAAVS